MNMLLSRCLATALILGCAPAAHAGKWSGYIAGEWTGFNSEALDARQHDSYLSASIKPEFHHEWEELKQSLSFSAFGRVDQHDAERTHADVRELLWTKVGGVYELRVGIGHVFWGVTEARHLVDIVNQSDLVENGDGEEKLGQPMTNLAFIGDWGTLNLFVLPGFRERTFPGVEGRPRVPLVVDVDNPRYESKREASHVDGALRYSHSLGGWDVGLSYFAGTGREPRLLATPVAPGQVLLVPFYDQIRQLGLDVQKVMGAWLWKLEAIQRAQFHEHFSAFDVGFEYTLTGIFGSAADVGLLLEYLKDNRSAVQPPTTADDDIFLGTRLTFNDAPSSQILIGVMADRNHHGFQHNIEASRRIGQSWKLSLEARGQSGVPASDTLLFNLRRDNYLRLELARYF